MVNDLAKRERISMMSGYHLGKLVAPFTVYLLIKGYKKPPSFSRLRIIDSRQVGFNCIP